MKAEHLIIRAVALFGAVMMTVSCGSRSDKPLLPNVSGKAGEVIAVMDRSDWDGNLGSATRDLLAADYPFLPQREPAVFHRQCPDDGIRRPVQDSQEHCHI